MFGKSRLLRRRPLVRADLHGPVPGFIAINPSRHDTAARTTFPAYEHRFPALGAVGFGEEALVESVRGHVIRVQALAEGPGPAPTL